MPRTHSQSVIRSLHGFSLAPRTFGLILLAYLLVAGDTPKLPYLLQAQSPTPITKTGNIVVDNPSTVGQSRNG